MQVGAGQIDAPQVVMGKVNSRQSGAAEVSPGEVEPGPASPVLFSPAGDGVGPAFCQGYMFRIGQEPAPLR